MSLNNTHEGGLSMHRNVRLYDSVLYLMFAGLSIFFNPCFVRGSETPQPIEYAYPDQSVWTTKTNSAGILNNPLLLLVDALFTKLEITWTAKPYPANRMFERLMAGQSNFSMLVQAPRLKDTCIFSRDPIVSTELRVYRIAGSSPIAQKEDLNGKKIITIRGYSYGSIGTYLKDPANDIVTFEANLHKSAFEMLANERAEYLLDYTGPSEEMLESHPIPGVTSDILKTLGVYFVLSKSYPDASKMMERLEQTAEGMDVSQWGLQKP